MRLLAKVIADSVHSYRHQNCITTICCPTCLLVKIA